MTFIVDEPSVLTKRERHMPDTDPYDVDRRRRNLEEIPDRVYPTPAAKRTVTVAWKGDLDPGDEFGCGGPVTAVHRLEGLPPIVEYIRDETRLWNPDPVKPGHGETQFKVGNNILGDFQDAMLMAIACANGLQGSTAWAAMRHTSLLSLIHI